MQIEESDRPGCGFLRTLRGGEFLSLVGLVAVGATVRKGRSQVQVRLWSHSRIGLPNDMKTSLPLLPRTCRPLSAQADDGTGRSCSAANQDGAIWQCNPQR